MMKEIFNNDVTSLIWYISNLKTAYEKGGKEMVKRFSNCGADTDDLEIVCYEKLSNLPECKYYDYLYEETEEGEELGDIYGEKWIFTTPEMKEYYRMLGELKEERIISEEQFNSYIDEMIDMILELVVNKQYNDGGFYCHLDDGTESGDECRIEIFRYAEGSFEAFSVMYGISTVFEVYKERVNELKELKEITERRRKSNGVCIREREFLR